MKYTAKSFTVPASSAKAPALCTHGWVDEKRKRCVLCGERVVTLYAKWPAGLVDVVMDVVIDQGEGPDAMLPDLGEGPE